MLAAERHRRPTGEGQLVKVALSDVAFAMVGNLGKIAEAQVCRRERQKEGNYLYGAFGRDFLTKDGRRVMVVALTPRQWKALVEATGLQEAFDAGRAADGRRPRRKEGDRFAAREVLGRDPQAVDDHPHAGGDRRDLRRATASAGGRTRRSWSWSTRTPAARPSNPMFEQVEQPGIGSYLMAGSPLHFSEHGRAARRAARRCWASTPTRSSPSCLGLSDAEIGRLHDDGVVAGPTPVAA